jgi:hypothetical protein
MLQTDFWHLLRNKLRSISERAIVRWNSTISVVETGIVVAFVLAAASDGGDLMLTVIFLILASIVAVLRVGTARELNNKSMWIVLTIIIVVLWGIFIQLHNSKTSIVSKAQIDEINKLSDVIGYKDEGQLQSAFDFPNMVELNIQTEAFLLSKCQEVSKNTNCDPSAYVPPGGSMYVDTLIAGPTIEHLGGGWVLNTDLKRISWLIRTKKAVEIWRTMRGFEQSGLLPGIVIAAVKDFNIAVAENTDNLIRVLNMALQESPDNFLHATDTSSLRVSVINGTYFHSFNPLKPKADAIISSIRLSLSIK